MYVYKINTIRQILKPKYTFSPAHTSTIHSDKTCGVKSWIRIWAIGKNNINKDIEVPTRIE